MINDFHFFGTELFKEQEERTYLREPELVSQISFRHFHDIKCFISTVLVQNCLKNKRKELR